MSYATARCGFHRGAYAILEQVDRMEKPMLIDRLRNAEHLVIIAGAGLGVDSGLPDFRGNEGFWRAYPALAGAGIDFETMATPACLEQDPRRGWGFYGHRLNLYRRAVPHEGFGILRDFIRQLSGSAFVITSNVDGQFQKGFLAHRMSSTICHLATHRGGGFRVEISVNPP